MGKNRVVEQPTFGQLFKYFRVKAGFVTLVKFADTLADKNIILCPSLLSRWQTDSRVPSNRETIISIIELFIQTNAITHLYQADMLLKASKKGVLSTKEKDTLSNLNNEKRSITFENEFIEFSYKVGNSIMDKNIDTIRFNFTISSKTHQFFTDIAKRKNITKAEFLRYLIHQYIEMEGRETI